MTTHSTDGTLTLTHRDVQTVLGWYADSGSEGTAPWERSLLNRIDASMPDLSPAEPELELGTMIEYPSRGVDNPAVRHVREENGWVRWDNGRGYRNAEGWKPHPGYRLVTVLPGHDPGDPESGDV